MENTTLDTGRLSGRWGPSLYNSWDGVNSWALWESERNIKTCSIKASWWPKTPKRIWPKRMHRQGCGRRKQGEKERKKVKSERVCSIKGLLSVRVSSLIFTQFWTSHWNQTSKVLEVNFCFACFPLEIVRRPALYDVWQVQVTFSSWPLGLPPSMYSPWQNGESGTDWGAIKWRRNCDPPHRVHVLIKCGPFWGYIWGWRWTNSVSHFLFFPGGRRTRWDEMGPLFTCLSLKEGKYLSPSKHDLLGKNYDHKAKCDLT